LTSEIEEFDLYPTDEEFYEAYEAEIESGLGEPVDAEVARRCFAAYLVSPFDTKRQTTPNFRLPQYSNTRVRLAGGG
jgi:hypothetical protein